MNLMTSTVKQTEAKVYPTATCPNCIVLKSMLKKEAIEFSEVNLASPAGLTVRDSDGANMARARINGANHAFASTSKSTICPDSTNGPCW